MRCSFPNAVVCHLQMASRPHALPMLAKGAPLQGCFGILLQITSRGGLAQLQKNLVTFLRSLMRTVPDHAARVRIYVGIDSDDAPLRELASSWPATRGTEHQASRGSVKCCAHVLARLCGCGRL